ncbi:MAG TPA: M48 family metalloprotease [Candidatus Acidoferrum sp.]|nr:M48 family metalloprotease [Candidatus Acidoferrum sp.]
MGLISSIMVRLLRAHPFEMQSLDTLAESMKATSILKEDRFHRYYKSSILPIPCLAYSDALVFNSNYYQMLSPDEVLAVGAHEFNHIAKKHIAKRLPRTVLPAAVLAVVMGYLFFIKSYSFLFIESAVVLSFFFFLFGSYYVNAKWFRKQETESDLSAVEFVNGAATISALSRLGPQKISWLSKLMPHTHPTMEQRIQNIQTAMKTGNSFNFTITFGDGTSKEQIN